MNNYFNLLLLCLIFVQGIVLINCQDDAGAEMELDMESMMGGDMGADKKAGEGKAAVVKTQIEQTTMALQQIGVILSKCLLNR